MMQLGNPVRIFPSRLADPHVQANARWIAVNARARRAFTLRGKDEVPELLAQLARGIRNDGSALVPLRQLGLADLWEEQCEGNEQQSFIDWYRLLNFNYPFVDYSAPAALERDSELMTAYAMKHRPPDASTFRPGPTQELMEGAIKLGSTPAKLTDELVAGILRVCAGARASVSASQGRQLRKTSPSGGARHPTEIGVIVASGGPNHLQGSWWYLPESHALSPWLETHLLADHLPLGSIAFVVRSRVERAMWRYRDARAFRPVIIDAGHVVESLHLVLGAAGWFTGWLSRAGWAGVEDPFSEPELGVLVATPTASEVAIPKVTKSSAKDFREPWITNPCIALSPLKDCLVAEILYPSVTRMPLSEGQVHALTYCMPSMRGDRPSSTEDILGRVGLCEAELRSLIESRALLSESEGLIAWKSASLWSRHGWFSSLLAHAYSTSQADSCVSTKSFGWLPIDMPKALDSRRTCRQFSGHPLPTPAWRRLEKAMSELPAKVMISVLRPSDSMESGNWRLSQSNSFERCGPAPDDEAIQSIAIGQPWTKGLAVIVWLFPLEVRGHSWELRTLDLGRAAQRLTLAVSDIPEVGVFQSPALVDDVMCELNELPECIDGAYLVGFGHTNSKPDLSTSQIHFQPSNIFRTSNLDE